MLVKERVLANVRIMIAMAVIMMLAATAIVLGNSHWAAAAETNAANTLKVSPVRTDIEIQAGTSKTVQTTVTNLTKAPITVRPIENDFVAGDESGTPALILDEGKFAPTHSLKRFMAPLSDVTIPAGKSKTIGVVITVPKNAQAGGYFGAVRFAPSTPDGGGQVNLSGSVASLILLTVPGKVTEKLNMTSFDIRQDGKAGSFFQSPNDLQASVRFENKGGLQAGPFGKVSVKQGDKVVYETDFNNKTPRDMILPDSARRFDIPLKKIESFGNYTVSATFTYGTKNQTIEVSSSFWVIPQFLIIATAVGVLVLVGLIVGIWMLIKSSRHRNRGLRGGFGRR